MFASDTSQSVREVGAVQSSKCQKLTDFLLKLSPNLDTLDLLGFLSDSINQQIHVVIRLQKPSTEPDEQTSGPWPEPESHQSNKTKQSTASGK